VNEILDIPEDEKVRTMRTLCLLFLALGSVICDMNDVDTVDTSSDTSSTSDQDSNLDNNDPNLHNPQPDQGYGAEIDNPRSGDSEDGISDEQKRTETEQSGPQSTAPTKLNTWSQQSLNALLEFGIIVGVAIMVGGMFMAMVGAEILYDKLVEKYREVFKKPKPLSDIERLHPAALVGTFSRYK